MRQQLAEPFSRNAYSLVLNSGVTGVLGLGYWLLAARTYGESDVGRGSVTISVMTLLSGLVALSLYGTLARFIGPSGRRAGRFVLTAYLLTVVVVAVLAVLFLLTLPFWGPSYSHLAGFTTGLFFVAAVIAAAVFTLQDGVLTGLRRAGWVPVENGVFGITKIVLLVVLASRNPRDGVWLSWVIPMAVLLLPVNALIFGRLIPRSGRAASASNSLPTRKQVGRFVAGDYVGALCMFTAFQLVPVLVAVNVPLYSFGYFYIAWTIGGVLTGVGMNMASSLTVEGVYDPSSLRANCRAAIIRTFGLLLPAAVIVALVAPYGLRLLGRGYVDAAPMLQLLAVAALPASLAEIYVGVLRAQNASARIARLQVARVVLMLCAVLAATRLHGPFAGAVPSTLTRVGIAVLLYETVLAVVVLPRLRTMAVGPGPSDTRAGTHRALLAVAPVAEADAEIGRAADGIPAVAPPAGGARRSPAGRISRWAPPGLVALCTGIGVATYAIPLRSVDLQQMSGFGLVSVLPVASVIGLGIMALSFLGAIALRRAHKILLGGQVVLWVLCLHGLPALLENLPRFPTAWTHVGFIEYISLTGSTATFLDARFSWPGFFALVSSLTDAHTWHDLVWVLRLVPVASNLAYLLPIALILSNLRAVWRAKWLALWLFAVLNWVGQDYFSPQNLAYFFYLVVVAVLITWFRPAPLTRLRTSGVGSWAARTGSSLLRPARPGELPPRPIGRRERVTLFVLILVIFAFTTASHQLTPFLMIGTCAGLVLVGRCVLRGLPLVMAVIAVGWLSFMAVAYWSGHLTELLGGVGKLGANVSSSVQGRAVDSGAEHLMVLHVRVALAMGAWGLAAIGAVRRRLKGFDDRIAWILLVCPIVGFGLQSYGGEIALRVYLFSLPGVCILAAMAFFPDDSGRRSWQRRVVGALIAVLCVPLVLEGFLVARFGNEAFEYVRTGEVAAIDYVVGHSPGPTRVLWPAAHPATLPTASFVNGYSAVDRVSYSPITVGVNPDVVGPVVDQLRALGPSTYLVTTRSQEAELVLAEGYPPGWGERFRARMAADPELRVLMSNPDAVVYVLASSPPETVVRDQPPSRTGVDSWTPLTGVGIVCFVALAGVLLARELRFLLASDGRRVRLTPLTLVAIPLAFGLVVVVLERFAVLA
ncbi:MAG: hypothetical protein JWO98_3112 [Frankiales bacterium]|nr:hypothetical protein [Frankiales bacterium]